MKLIDTAKTILSLVSKVGISTLLPLLNTQLDEASIKALQFVVLQTNKSCLEYAPEGCPPAYTRLREINIEELPPIYAEFFEEEDGHHWLKTNRLSEQMQQFYNLVATYPATPASSSGPAGQVWSHGT